METKSDRLLAILKGAHRKRVATYNAPTVANNIMAEVYAVAAEDPWRVFPRLAFSFSAIAVAAVAMFALAGSLDQAGDISMLSMLGDTSEMVSYYVMEF